jgi:hypothetical protein
LGVLLLLPQEDIGETDDEDDDEVGHDDENVMMIEENVSLSSPLFAAQIEI